MSSNPEPRPHDDGFQFGGRLSLDLTWTVRYRAVLPTELLVEPDDVRRWLDAVGLPALTAPQRRDVTALRELREAIHRAATAHIDGRPLDAGDVEIVNRRAAHPPPVPVLVADGAPATVQATTVPAALSAIARDAIDLLAGTPAGRLRRCEGPFCSLLFHDESRPGTRRWCATARCGNRVNTKAYRARRGDRSR